MRQGIFTLLGQGRLSCLKAGFPVLLLIVATVTAYARTGSATVAPLNEKQVLGLVAGGVASERVADLIRNRGIDFTPTSQYLDKLRSAGASASLIETVRRTAPHKGGKALSGIPVSAGQKKLSETHNAVGLADMKKDHPQRATGELQEALRDNPENAQAHNNLGLAFQAQRELSAAINEYYQALRLNPGYLDARYNLAFALELEGDAQDAVVEFREVEKQKPDDPFVHFRLATALEQNGDSAAALEEYRSALKLAPNNLAIHKRYMALLARSGSNRNE
ncbi:MAG: tetratricopeptide repeat protein [Terriglobia bacterium]